MKAAASYVQTGPAVPRALLAEQPMLLRAENLRKAFGGQTILADVSLELRRGEVVLLRGANGSGKTTLLNILTGNLEADAGHIQLFINGVAERFAFPRRWWQDTNPFDHFLPERVAKEGVGRTWQEIRLFSTQSLLDNIATATRGHLGENPAWSILRRPAVRKQEVSIREAAATVLSRLGLEGREETSADKASLGQSKRVAIGRALQAGARILFLDEPLAGLDAQGITDVMELLEQIAINEQVTIVIVEHVMNIPRVLALATTVWTLEKGSIAVERAADVRSTAMLQSTGTTLDRLLRMAERNVTVLRQPLSDEAVLSTITPSTSAPGDVVLNVEDLVVYRGSRLVIGKEDGKGKVEGLSFALRQNELAIMQAPNAWGKTTLLEAIAGTLPVDRGAIWLNGEQVQDLPPWKRTVSLLQARNKSFPSLTVDEALQLANIDKVPAYLEPLKGRQISGLSGGEQQKVAVACAIGGTSTVVLLDEPFSALEEQAVEDLMRWILAPSQIPVLVAVPLMRA